MTDVALSDLMATFFIQQQLHNNPFPQQQYQHDTLHETKAMSRFHADFTMLKFQESSQNLFLSPRSNDDLFTGNGNNSPRRNTYTFDERSRS